MLRYEQWPRETSVWGRMTGLKCTKLHDAVIPAAARALAHSSLVICRQIGSKCSSGERNWAIQGSVKPTRTRAEGSKRTCSASNRPFAVPLCNIA